MCVVSLLRGKRCFSTRPVPSSPQGLVYTNTDVEEVNVWMVKHFTEHPLFTRVPEDQLVGGNAEPARTMSAELDSNVVSFIWPPGG